MKKKQPDTTILTAPFWAGFVLLGLLPPAGGAVVRYLIPSGEAHRLTPDLALLVILLITGALAAAALLGSLKRRYHGLYTLGAAALLAHWFLILFFGAAERLLEAPPFFASLPSPGGLVLVLMLGAWAGLFKAYYPESRKNSSPWKWVFTAAAVLLPGVLYFLKDRGTEVLIYGAAVLLPQAVMLLWLSLRTPEETAFLRAVVLAGLLSDALGFFLLTPSGQYLPVTAGILTQAAGPWIFLYGLRRKAGGLS